MHHSPPGRPGLMLGSAEQPHGSGLDGGAFHRQDIDSQSTSTELATTVTEAVSAPKLPPFWRANPDLWFAQAEATFISCRIRSDERMYSTVLSMLDPETVVDIADVIRAPPDQHKYATLKGTILARLMDSADRQLIKLFTQLELGDKRPSQLLRHMRSLAGSRVPEDVLKVKWFDLLPANTQRLLRICKTASLEELAAIADEVVDGAASVAATSRDAFQPMQPHSVAMTGTSRAGDSAVIDQLGRVVSELASLRVTMAQLVGRTDAIWARLEAQTARDSVGRAFGRRSRSRPRSPSAGATNGICSYHRRWGAQAKRCYQPCSFHSNSSAGN